MPKAKYATNADGYKRRQITYTDSAGNTRTKRLTAKTDKQLDAKIAAFYKSIGAGTVSMDSRTTFGEYVDYYIESHTSCWKPSTAYNNKCQANMLCQLFGNRLLSSFTPSFVAASFSTLSSTSRRFARAVFRSAYNDGLLARDPGINLKLCAPPSSMHRSLTRQQISAVTSAAISCDNCLFVLFMLYAGLRVMEAAYIDIDRDVDFDKGTVSVRGSYSVVNQRLVPSTPKTASGIRTIPLMPQLSAAIQGKHGPVLRLPDNPKKHYVLTMISHVIKASGVQFHTHDFRHTFASMLWEAGIDIKSAQLWLGHASSSVTLNIYTHISAEHQQESAAKAAQFFSNL